MNHHTAIIADDDPNILLIISEIVKNMGIAVLEAEDGHKAKKLLTECAVDLAILDVSMPGYTGIELCKMVKDSPEGKVIPVILVTARDTLEDKIFGLDSGADEYLTKPFQVRELEARIRACLRVRDLNCKLKGEREEVLRLQAALIEKERKLVASQIGGAAAHAMGQPLSAVLLNLFLIESLPKDDPRFKDALESTKQEAAKLKGLLEKIKNSDTAEPEKYYQEVSILKLK